MSAVFDFHRQFVKQLGLLYENECLNIHFCTLGVLKIRQLMFRVLYSEDTE